MQIVIPWKVCEFFCHNIGSRSDNLFDHDEIYLIYYYASNAKATTMQPAEWVSYNREDCVVRRIRRIA